MQKILVIGSEGFIGNNCYHYLRKLYNVAGCDLTDSEKGNYFKISNDGDISQILENKYNYIINCAGAANVAVSFHDPLSDFSKNTLLVLNILNSIRKLSPETRLINLSSAAVYGNPKSLPITEFDETNPISPYGYHKLYSEMLCKEYRIIYGVSSISLRIFSAYGEGLMKQLFWELYSKTKKSRVVNLWGSGDETRDFIYIGDIMSIINIIIINDDFSGEVINVANGQQVTIKDAVMLFTKILGWDGEISFNGKVKVGDPRYWCAEISKIQSMGYKKQYDFDHGLLRYKKWLEKK